MGLSRISEIVVFAILMMESSGQKILKSELLQHDKKLIQLFSK